MRRAGITLIVLGCLAILGVGALLLIPRDVVVDTDDLNAIQPPGYPGFVEAQGRASCNAFGSTMGDQWDRLCEVAGPDVLVPGIPVGIAGVAALGAGLWITRRTASPAPPY